MKTLVRQTNILLRSADMRGIYDGVGGDPMLMRVLELIAVLTAKDAQAGFIIPSPEEGKPPLFVLAPEDQPTVMEAALKLIATAYLVSPDELQKYLDHAATQLQQKA